MAEEKDVEELKEILTVVEEKIPKLIREIMDAVVSPEKAKELAEATADFYKKLRESGMPDELAAELTKEFMKSQNVMGVLKDVLSGGKTLKGKKVVIMGEKGKKVEIEGEDEE